MSIEEEIDQIFLHEASMRTDQNKIKNLQSYLTHAEEIEPFLEVIGNQVAGIKTNFLIYNIQLEALAKDLELIQDKNKDLEHRLNTERSVFEKLKDLTLALNIDDMHLQILDNGDFASIDDLVHMQESLNILSGFEVDKFTIRIVIETRDKIIRCQRNFYKRFVNYLSRSFVRSGSSGELKVHKELYTKMKQYKFIFTHSVKFPDCFEIVFGSYISHSKRMYESEFSSHLDSIVKLVDDADKLRLSIEVLLQSFESLVSCEKRYLENLLDNPVTSEKGTSEIFKETLALIFNFLDKMFQKSQIATIVALEQIGNVNSAPENTPDSFLTSYRRDLTKKKELLIELFTKTETDRIKKTCKRDNLDLVLKQEGMLDLKLTLIDLYLERYMRNMSEYDLKKLLDRYKMMFSLNIPLDILKAVPAYDQRKETALDECMNNIEKKIIGDVFGDEKEEEKVIELIKTVKTQKRETIEAEAQLLTEIRRIILDHSDEEKKKKYKALFER